jgi:hypothetical protein
MNTVWIPIAVEEKNPRLTVAIAYSRPLVVTSSPEIDKLLSTRQLLRTDINDEREERIN